MDVSQLRMDDFVLTAAGVVAVVALPYKDGFAVVHPMGNDEAEWRVSLDGLAVDRNSDWDVVSCWPLPGSDPNPSEMVRLSRLVCNEHGEAFGIQHQIIGGTQAGWDAHCPDERFRVVSQSVETHVIRHIEGDAAEIRRLPACTDAGWARIMEQVATVGNVDGGSLRMAAFPLLMEMQRQGLCMVAIEATAPNRCRLSAWAADIGPGDAAEQGAK